MSRHNWEYTRDRNEHFRLLDRRMRAQASTGGGRRRRRQWARLGELQPDDEGESPVALLDGLVAIDCLAEVHRRGRLVGYLATGGLDTGCYGWAADFTFLGRYFSRADALSAVMATAKGLR